MNLIWLGSMFLSLLLSGVPLRSIANTSEHAIQDEPSFHYVIINTGYMNGDRPEIARVTVKVLMDEASFSEGNLRQLFGLLSKRFSAPDWMIVFVYTNIEQIETPEQRDFAKPSDSINKPMNCTHQSAFLSRKNGNEFFRYNPMPGRCEWKTVVLKGDLGGLL